jgi:hypothetical protein
MPDFLKSQLLGRWRQKALSGLRQSQANIQPIDNSDDDDMGDGGCHLPSPNLLGAA